MSMTQVVPVPPGAAVPVTADGGAPAGATLINNGDNGGTVWVRSGPTGPAMALTPGGSLEWTDQATLPYLFLAAGAARPESVTVTDQADGYANPVAVAAATAAQLLAQGIPQAIAAQVAAAGIPVTNPTTLASAITAAGIPVNNPDAIASSTATQLATGGVPQNFRGQLLYSNFLAAHGTSGPINVGAWSSLTVVLQYPGDALVNTVVQLGWRVDSATPLGAGGADGYLTADVSIVLGWDMAWSMPVKLPYVVFTNTAASTRVNLIVYGSNRHTDRLRIVGNDTGVAQLITDAMTATTGVAWPLNAINSIEPPVTKFSGAVKCTINVPVAGTVRARWVHPDGTGQLVRFAVVAGDSWFDWSHPRVPVNWTYTPGTAPTAGSKATLVVTDATN